MDEAHRLAAFEQREVEWEQDGWTVSTVRARLDRTAIREFLRNDSYWLADVDGAVIDRAIDNSVPFGIYAADGRFAGFARVVTDGALFAYLRDVFTLPEFRGKGIGSILIDHVLRHPDLAPVRTWLLATDDAHEFYRRFGFVEPENPGVYMRRSGAAQ